MIWYEIARVFAALLRINMRRPRRACARVRPEPRNKEEEV